jgi:hypothetical protein
MSILSKLRGTAQETTARGRRTGRPMTGRTTTGRSRSTGGTGRLARGTTTTGRGGGPTASGGLGKLLSSFTKRR